jgi:hypothetical protein
MIPGTTQVLVFRFDEGLGSDGGRISGEHARVNVATRLGVTVEISGLAKDRKVLSGWANEMAEIASVCRTQGSAVDAGRYQGALNWTSARFIPVR